MKHVNFKILRLIIASPLYLKNRGGARARCMSRRHCTGVKASDGFKGRGEAVPSPPLIGVSIWSQPTQPSIPPGSAND